jgi:hypothetical protein
MERALVHKKGFHISSHNILDIQKITMRWLASTNLAKKIVLQKTKSPKITDYSTRKQKTKSYLKD